MPDERKSVEEAFAQSVIWGFKAEAEDSSKFLIDFTPFLLRDSHNVARKLGNSNQGSYQAGRKPLGGLPAQHQKLSRIIQNLRLSSLWREQAKAARLAPLRQILTLSP